MRKGTKLYSMWHMKCPRCMEGDLFETGSFSFSKPFDMLERCPNCRLKYEIEPGFFYGSMYVSYILYGWFSLFFVGVCMLILDMSVNASIAALIVFSAFVFVWVYRISRSIWLGFNVKYNPNIKGVQK